MKKYLFSLALFGFVGVAHAQQTIVESLQTKRSGEGVVRIYQDARIAELIGSRFVAGEAEPSQTILTARGFRVQVYAGNNSRVARNEANAVAEKVKEEFPDMPVYTYFQPPRWLCRVGDYKSIEEAHAAMRRLHESGNFKETTIVREQINISIE